MNMLETLQNLLNDSGFVSFFADGGWKNLVMIAVSCLLLYLGIKKQFEPLLLVGIAFGCLLVNVSNFFIDGASSSNALYHPNCGVRFWKKAENTTTAMGTSWRTADCWIFCISASSPVCIRP